MLEATESLLELKSPLFHFYFVKHAMIMSLDRTSHEKELVAEWLANLCKNAVIDYIQVLSAIIYFNLMLSIVKEK